MFSAQESDTIVVYEEVLIRDTIYVESEIPKEIPKNKKDISKQTEKNNFQYGISILSGAKNSNYFQSASDVNNFGFGAGIWVSKSFANNRLSFSISANYLQWMKSFEIDANKVDSELNGYYFTESNEPVLFQKLNNQHSEITIPIKVFFNFFGNFSPYFGVFGNYTNYKMGFLIPENYVLNKYSDFKTNKTSLGWISGLQFKYKKWSIFAEYQQNEFQNLQFENPETDNLIFKFENGFKDKTLLLGFQYSFGK
jgi:hypothetical protein